MNPVELFLRRIGFVGLVASATACGAAPSPSTAVPERPVEEAAASTSADAPPPPTPPEACPSTATGPTDSLVDAERFHDLFQDEEISEAFIAKHRIETIVRTKNGERDRMLRFDEDGRAVEERQLDDMKTLRIWAYRYQDGLLVETTLDDRVWNKTSSTAYKYDERRRRTQEASDDGEVIAFDWDDCRQVGMRKGDYAVTYTFDGDRKVGEKIEGPNTDVVTRRTYNEQGQLIQVDREGMNGNAVDRYELTYDAGRIRRITFQDKGKLIAEHTYRFDEEGRLIERAQKSYVSAMGTFAWTYEYTTR